MSWLVALLVALGDGATSILLGLGMMVLQGTALALAAWAVATLLGRRLSPALVASLWSVVLVKFLLPVGPAMPWSLADLFARFTNGAVPVHVLAADEAVVPTMVAPAVGSAISFQQVLVAVVALAAVALLVVVATIRLTRVVRRHRHAVRVSLTLPLANSGLHRELSQVAAAMGTSVPSLRLAASGSPHLVGLRHPVLVLPQELTPPELGDLRAAAFAHELAHLRRRDPWTAILPTIALALLWWWPVVRVAATRLSIAREAACDAWALAKTPIAPSAYARLLIRFAQTSSTATADPLIAHMGSTSGALRGRVGDVLSGPRPIQLTVVSGLGLAMFAALGLAGARDVHAAPAPVLVCVFNPEVAEQLLAAYPEADVDGDGALTRGEVCEFEAGLRRQLLSEALASQATDLDVGTSQLDLAISSSLLTDAACCNCQASSGIPSAFGTLARSPATDLSSSTDSVTNPFSSSAAVPTRSCRSEGVSP